MDKSLASRTVVAVIAVFLLLIGVGLGGFALLRQVSPNDAAPAVDTTRANSSTGTPKLDVSTVASGLRYPWEVAFLPDKTMLITERSGSVYAIVDGAKKPVFKPEDLVAQGEGGLMGLAVDPKFENNRYIYICYNGYYGQEISVARYTLDDGLNGFSESKTIVGGIPMNPSGRHSGCRIGYGPDGNLWIATGDAADEDNPQDLSSLGGKILRVDREGEGVAGNITSGDRRIYSFGHRNTQGLAFYQKSVDGSYGISIEHGSDRDDEANALIPGNFGWAPGAGYDESASMTDTTRFPDAVPAIWSSGYPTIAPSDADFLRGKEWGAWDGRLAMGVLKNKHLRILEINDGKVDEQVRILDGEYGRLRAVTMGPDGSLYISTDNGSNDKILKITPSIN